MLARIIAFELRYQLRGPAFIVCALLFFLLAFAALGVSSISLGAGGNVHRNAPFATAQIEQAFVLFSPFVIAALASSAILRDDDTGFGQILYATRLKRRAYVYGRFLGAFGACLLVFLMVPLGLWLGSCAPWLDHATLGPTHWGAQFQNLAILGLPSIFLLTALMFAAATLFRSMMATYITAVVLIVVLIAGEAVVGSRPDFETAYTYLEPFGSAVFGHVTRYWTAAERNTQAPSLQNVMLWNRLIWCGVAAALVLITGETFSFTRSKARARAHKIEAVTLPVPRFSPKNMPRPRFDAATTRAQFLLRLRFEIRQVIRSPGFIILLLTGLAFSGGMMFDFQTDYGTSGWPITRLVIQRLAVGFSTVSALVAAFYAGEIVWRERDRRMHELIGAAPVPNGIFVTSKLPAIGLALFGMLAIGVPIGIATQIAHGYWHFELRHYLTWYILPNTASTLSLAVLALFLQILSPYKYIGWGLLLLYFVFRTIAGVLGLSDDLYNYGSTPGLPLSDMNGSGSYWIGYTWCRAYWGFFSILLLITAHVLWPRGTITGLKTRLAGGWGRFHGAPGIIAALAFGGFVVSGSVIFTNTHLWNTYATSQDQQRFMAQYERKYLRYAALPQPDVTSVRFAVDIHPNAASMTVRGHYTLTNHTPAPIDDIHVRMINDDTKIVSMTLEHASLAQDDRKFLYRIYHLDKPLAPGASIGLDFQTQRIRHGFTNYAEPGFGIEPNGTFISNGAFAPTIGMSRNGLLQDRTKRRKYGLPPELRMPRLEDTAAQGQNYVHASWTMADITVTTDADQTPLAPGDKVSDIIQNGRRTARFVTPSPVLNFFAVLSARYAERHATWNGPGGPVDLAVYFDPRHAWNVDRMLHALQAGLSYDVSAFGPYQFHTVRIVEFPGYRAFAQAFAGTIPYSESIGFIANLSNPKDIDYVTYVTAHELSHQWWAHQIVGADMQGATMLSETLAQYSALMTERTLYGPDKLRRFLKYELDSYLRSRGGELLGEQPLERVENQQYIHYKKGSLVMYRLADVIGADHVNAALRGLLDDYRFKPAPYPRSLALVDRLRQQTTDQALISDLFERITLYDLRALSATSTRRADGKYDVTLKLSAEKLYADAKGEEHDAPLSEPVWIGMFTAKPGQGAFNPHDVISMRTQTMTSGEHTLHLVADRKPLFAGIDPYIEMIDRHPDDNVIAVTGR